MNKHTMQARGIYKNTQCVLMLSKQNVPLQKFDNLWIASGKDASSCRSIAKVLAGDAITFKGKKYKWVDKKFKL